MLVCIAFFYFKMKNTKMQSSYLFLFKINAVGATFSYLLYNPLFSDIMILNPNKNLSWIVLAFHVCFLVFGSLFFVLFKGHMKTRKLQLS